AQAGDGAQQVELAELLLNAVLGDAELAGDGQVRRVVLEQGVQVGGDHAAQALAVARGGGGRGGRGGEGRRQPQQQPRGQVLQGPQEAGVPWVCAGRMGVHGVPLSVVLAGPSYAGPLPMGAAGPARQAAGPCLRQGVSPTGIDRPSSATLPRFFGTPPKK